MHFLALVLVCLASVGQAHIAHNSADPTVVSNEAQALAFLLQSLNPAAALQAARPRVSIKGVQRMRTQLDSMGMPKVARGTLVQGKVVSIHDYGARIDIGTGNSALLPINQISSDYVSYVPDVLSVGDRIKAWVIRKELHKVDLSTKALEPEPGDMIKNPELVFERAEEIAAKYKQVLDNLKPGMVVDGVVEDVQDFGAFIDIGIGSPALLPISQISSTYISNIHEVLFEGSQIKVIVLQKNRGKITVSTKRLELNRGDMLRNPELVFKRAGEMAAEYQPGMVVEGFVEEVRDYGAHIDIGTEQLAFLPKSRISSEYVSDVADVLSEGKRIKAMVLKTHGAQVTLSTEDLEPEPGDMVKNPELVFEKAEEISAKHKERLESLQPGMVVEGVVKLVKHFGAFIDIGTARNVLLHRSEVTSAHISNLEDVLPEGSSIKAVVLKKEGDQITLGTKCLEPEPGDMIKNPELVFERAEEMAAKYNEGSDNLEPAIAVEGVVAKVMDNEAFIDIGTEKPALLPISEISSNSISNVNDVLSEGARIKALVLNMEDDQVTLSTKYLEPAPGDMIKNPWLVFEMAEEMAVKYKKAWHDLEPEAGDMIKNPELVFKRAEEMGAKWKESLDNLQPGIVVEGVVDSLIDDLALVDIGIGKNALLHRDKISSEWVSVVADVLSEGSKIKAMVLTKENNQVSLSTEDLEPEPGDMIKNPELVFEMAEEIGAKQKERWDSLHPGMVVEGVVDSLRSYAAFINIGVGRRSLLRIGDISHVYISNIADVLSKGGRIKAMILEKRADKILLGTKCLEPEPGDMKKNPELVFERAEEIGAKRWESLDNLRPGSIVEGVVDSLWHWGALIDIGVPKLAMLNRREMSSDQSSHLEDVLSEGSRIKATVVEKEFDAKTGLTEISLSTNYLEPDHKGMLGKALRMGREYQKQSEQG